MEKLMGFIYSTTKKTEQCRTGRIRWPILDKLGKVYRYLIEQKMRSSTNGVISTSLNKDLNWQMRRFIDMTEINLSLFKFFGLLDRTLFFSAFANYGNLQFVPLSERALFLVTLSRPEVHLHFEGNTKLKISCQEALRNFLFTFQSCSRGKRRLLATCICLHSESGNMKRSIFTL